MMDSEPRGMGRGYGRGRVFTASSESRTNEFGDDHQRENQDTVEITVPSQNVGRIIGRGGAKIRELQDESGARINIKKDGNSYGDQSIELVGSTAAIATAKQLIDALVNPVDTDRRNDRGEAAQDGSSREATEMMVPRQSVGKIIGRGGAKIRELQDESGARININKERDSQGEAAVELSGTPEAVARARQLIDELVNSDEGSSRSFGSKCGYIGGEFACGRHIFPC